MNDCIIPDFIISIVDILGDQKKAGISNEVNKLRKLESDDKITIFKCIDRILIPPAQEIDAKEDDIILEIANLTNSILFTGDENLKVKAILDKRPTIYIHPKDSKKIKIIEETRTK